MQVKRTSPELLNYSKKRHNGLDDVSGNTASVLCCQVTPPPASVAFTVDGRELSGSVSLFD